MVVSGASKGQKSGSPLKKNVDHLRVEAVVHERTHRGKATSHPGRLTAQGGLDIGQLMATFVRLIEGITIIGTGAGD